jgi:heme exporter protein B
MLRWIVWRDLILAWRRRADALSTLFFFVIVVSLFPLGIGPETELLKSIVPGVVWWQRCWHRCSRSAGCSENDYQDGTLEQLLPTPQPLYLVVLGKVAAQWVTSELRYLYSTIASAQFGLSNQALLILVVSLVLGTPVPSLMGSIGAALTLGLRSSSVLISILVLPLYIPVLIFGSGAVEANIIGQPSASHLYLLGAISVLSISLLLGRICRVENIYW